MALIITISFLLIFFIKIIGFWALPPDIMDSEKGLKTNVKNLVGVVKICQTACFGKPSIVLVPPKKSGEMSIDFLDDDRVSLSFPLLLKNKENEKSSYLKIFSDYNLVSFESTNHVTVYLNRKDNNLGKLITLIYRKVFDADDTDTFEFTVKTLISDLKALVYYKITDHQFNDDYKFVSNSAKYKGKSISRVQTEKILNEANLFLYPPIIFLSYKVFGLTTMCWTALICLALFTAYAILGQKKSVKDS